MIKWLLALAALVLPISVALADPLVVRGNRLFVAASVNGHPVEALLDSAAEISVADAAAADGLGLGAGDDITARGSGGTQKARLVPSADLAALGVAIKGVPVAVVDLSDVSARLVGRRIEFILGRDFFGSARLAIDIEAGVISVLPAATVPDGRELAITEHDGIVAIPVDAGGLAVQADFDLGNGTGVLISQALSKRLALKPVGLEPAGGIGGSKLREVVYLPSLTIAGRRFEHVRAHVDPLENAGDLNIGVPQLRQFRIVTDFAAGKVWLSPR